MNHVEKSLSSQFEKAGLPVRIVDRQSRVNRAFRDTGTAFLMDIARDPEEFRVFVGRTQAEIVSVDRRRQQAVLVVHEAASEMVRNEWDTKQRRMVARVVRVEARKRHTLVGMDECHLFAAPLPQAVTTVAEAHRILKPHRVERAERQGAHVLRQGEWFLTRVDRDAELKEIETQARRVGVRRKTALGPGGRRGRPHVADERVIFNPIPPRDASGAHLRAYREYARGAIRHPDHHALRLKTWHRVTGNTERNEAAVRGMTWID